MAVEDLTGEIGGGKVVGTPGLGPVGVFEVLDADEQVRDAGIAAEVLHGSGRRCCVRVRDRDEFADEAPGDFGIRGATAVCELAEGEELVVLAVLESGEIEEAGSDAFVEVRDDARKGCGDGGSHGFVGIDDGSVV